MTRKSRAKLTEQQRHDLRVAQGKLLGESRARLATQRRVIAGKKLKPEIPFEERMARIQSKTTDVVQDKEMWKEALAEISTLPKEEDK